MNTSPLTDYDQLSRMAARLLGAEQLAALSPSQRALLAYHLRDLLETRGELSVASPEDVRLIFERIAGFPPVLRESADADDAF
jgi:hypothetical protein